MSAAEGSSPAESLPPGWTAELKIRRKSRRKDWYFTDPVSGYIFRSLKDINRYLKTGEVGRLAFKPKDKSSTDMELEDNNLPTKEAVNGKKFEHKKARKEKSLDQNLKSIETENRQITESTCAADGKEDNAVSNGKITESSGSEEGEDRSESSKLESGSTALIGTSPLKRHQKNEFGEHLEINKSRKKIRPDLPRRASNRLAGIEVDLTPQPKTRSQASSGQPVEAATVEPKSHPQATSKLAGEAVTIEPKPRRQATNRQADEAAPMEPISRCQATDRQTGEAVTAEPKTCRQATKRQAGEAATMEPKTRRQVTSRQAAIGASALGTPDGCVGNDGTENSLDEKEGHAVVLLEASLSVPALGTPEPKTRRQANKRQAVEAPSIEPKTRHQASNRKVATRASHLGTPEGCVGKDEMDNFPGEKEECPVGLPETSLSNPGNHIVVAGAGEPKTRRQATKRQAVEAATIEFKTRSQASTRKASTRASVSDTLEGRVGKDETDNSPGEKEERPVGLTEASLSNPGNHSGNIDIVVSATKEPKTRLQATKRQAGEAATMEPKTRLGATNRQAATRASGLGTSEGRVGKDGMDNSPGEKEERPFGLPEFNLSTLEEHNGKIDVIVAATTEPKTHRRATKGKAGEAATIEPKTRRQATNRRAVTRASGLGTPEGQVGKIEIIAKSVKVQGGPVDLLPTSKELAGEAETTSILKEVQRLRSSEACNGKVKINDCSSDIRGPLDVLPPAFCTRPEDYGGKAEKINQTSQKQEFASAVLDGSGAGLRTDNKVAYVKQESSMNLSDLWTDPCIEFAVKTLTGDIPIGGDNKANEYPKPDLPLHLPLGGLWTDPCIDFAVKTLTGDIPIAENLISADYFQQHGSSTENQGVNIGSSNFSQSEVLPLHFGTAEYTRSTQQNSIHHNHRNGSLQSSGTSTVNQGVIIGPNNYSRSVVLPQQFSSAGYAQSMQQSPVLHNQRNGSLQSSGMSTGYQGVNIGQISFSQNLVWPRQFGSAGYARFAQQDSLVHSHRHNSSLQSSGTSTGNQGVNIGPNNFSQSMVLPQQLNFAEYARFMQQNSVTDNNGNGRLQSPGSSSGLNQHVNGSSGQRPRPPFF